MRYCRRRLFRLGIGIVLSSYRIDEMAMNSVSNKTKYYPHIDGIRALAVIPVVINHIYAGLCPGGFAGVDVFFVISGYLITGGILRDLYNGSFSIAEFYSRRIRRIFPAYFAAMLGVFCMGMLVYYAAPMRDLLDTMLPGIFFSSNLYFHFWLGDYFSPSMRNNPLMHLWSLSVEEQFYLFIPFLYALVWKLGHRRFIPIFSGIMFCSFVGAVWMINGGAGKSAFYLVHWRAWELLAGGLLAMFVQKRRELAIQIQPENTQWLRSLSAWVGLVLVMATYWLITEKTTFPGLAALAPVLGTVILIREGGQGLVGRILSQKHIVWVGKISFSLYLVHWPVIVFWRWLTYDTLFVPDYFCMAVVSILLAQVSWRWVEQPVRQSTSWSKTKAFTLAITGMSLLTLISIVCLANRCWPQKIHVEANAASVETKNSRIAIVIAGKLVKPMMGIVDQGLGTKFSDCMQRHFEHLQLTEGFSLRTDGFLNFGGGFPGDRILIIGDSHAGALIKGAQKWSAEYQQGVSVWSQGNMDVFDSSNNKQVLELLAEAPFFTRIIVVQYWSRHNLNCDKDGTVDINVRQFISQLQALNKKIYLVSDVAGDRYARNTPTLQPRMTMFPPRAQLPEWNHYFYGQPMDKYEATQGNINRLLAQICEESGVTLIPLQTCFLSDGKYHFFTEEDGKRKAFYRDSNHLVGEGSARAVAFIMEYISNHEN